MGVFSWINFRKISHSYLPLFKDNYLGELEMKKFISFSFVLVMVFAHVATV